MRLRKMTRMRMSTGSALLTSGVLAILTATVPTTSAWAATPPALSLDEFDGDTAGTLDLFYAGSDSNLNDIVTIVSLPAGAVLSLGI
jgi:hypothetical protein